MSNHAYQNLDPGTIVTLSPNFYQYEDAAKGPLSPGEVGIILQNDRSGKPYHVAAPNGRTWWYCKSAIVAAQGASASTEDANAICHRAHPHRLKSCQMGSGWSCDVCGQAGHQVHFRCTTGCDWDVCGGSLLCGDITNMQANASISMAIAANGEDARSPNGAPSLARWRAVCVATARAFSSASIGHAVRAT